MESNNLIKKNSIVIFSIENKIQQILSKINSEENSLQIYIKGISDENKKKEAIKLLQEIEFELKTISKTLNKSETEISKYYKVSVSKKEKELALEILNMGFS